MHPRGPLIFILHQYLVIGRWWILTSVIQRHKNLKYVVCKSALNYSGDNSGHVSSWAHTQVRQYRRTEIIFFKGGNILPNGPEKSHPNLHPQPAVGLTAHLTLSIIIFKFFFTSLLSKHKKHLLVLIFISLITCEIEKCHVYRSFIVFV